MKINTVRSSSLSESCPVSTRRRLPLTFLLLALLFGGSTALLPAANVIDIWRAEDINLNDGDTVSSWSSTNGRVAQLVAGTGTPVLKRTATPAGGSVVRFNRNRLAVANSVVGGRTAFSIAIVFRPDAVGAGDNTQWYGKTGLIDAEQGGITADWGTVLDQSGQVGIGIGGGDTSVYSAGASLVDSNYHVAVFTWGGGVQGVYVDSRAGVTAASPSGARNTVPFSIGGINTDENGGVRRFVGDIVEIRFYDAALSATEVTNVVQDLSGTHILAKLPRIRSFTASTNQTYLGTPVTLSWAVSNAAAVAIDQGVGSVSATGNVQVVPAATTTYTLTATNTNGLRTASVTVLVDPGIPSATALTTNTPRNTPILLALKGTDPQGSNLTYSIVNSPQHGSLSGTPPNVTYTPATGYDGFDSFTFKVNDGQFDSAPATVTIKVVPPATAPTGILLSSTNIPSGAAPGSFVAALTAIDLNNADGDTQTFTLVSGFGNNSQFAINGNILSAGPTFAGGEGTTFSLRIRATDSTALTYDQTFTLVVVDVPRPVIINEVHYNGPTNKVREEFIELYNPGSTTVDVSQWRISGGVDYFIPANTFMAPNSFLLVAQNPSVISSKFGKSALGPWSGGINNDGERITLRDSLGAVIDEVDFKSEFPWPISANGDGPSMQLVHPSLDNGLGSSWRSALPTPGATNLVYATNAAPNIRQVGNSPSTPSSTNQVTITAKVTDPQGVASVMLSYQIVAPGSYIPATFPLTANELNTLNSNPLLTNSLNPAFENAANWTSTTMRDDGLGNDAVAGDGVYTAVIPQQANRTLVRYRITCTDTLGASRRAPFEDDPSLNFAYFVYNGIPAYLGFSPAALQTLPVYSLITRDADLTQCTAWFNTADQLIQDINGARNEGRLYFNWEGAIVYDGVVYDHIHYRLRGANGRYHTGKRSFRFRFNDGLLLNAKDQYGKKFPTKWRELTTGKGQSNRGGEQYALNEVVNFYMWNKVGVPAPNTFHFHFRVIKGASEAGTDQYSGDFWGLNWGQEKYDVNFLTAHNLPKGNLYKLVDNYVLGADERRYQAADAPANAEDFFNIENNLSGFQTMDWLNAHANYTNWYRYFAIAEAIRHYDTWPSANKNGAWYFEPPYAASNSFYGRMMQLPYDSTDTWGPTWNSGEDVLYNGIFATGAIGGDAGEHPEMQLEYRNVVREIRDLLFQQDQIYAIIDAHMLPITNVAAADFARWRNNTPPASYTYLAISNSPGSASGLPAYGQDMKNFMFVGGTNAWWIDRQTVPSPGWVTRLDVISADANIPTRPTITYTGPTDHPVDGLVFQSSAFADPDGAGTFGAMRWRIAEVLPAGTVVSNLPQLKLEWDAAWDSGEIAQFNSLVTIPDWAVQPDHVYRVRVKHKDNTGRWSQWSAPIEFRPSPRDTVSELKGNLVFNEIMYNPPGQGATSGDEFEFLELKNIGQFSLHLSGLTFSQGITFTFTNGTTLAPGATFLLARNPSVLVTRYPGVVVNGVYSGKLDNGGETIAISHPTQGEIVSVTYGDRAPWPVAADGFGFSLVLADAATGTYQASSQKFGSPGADGGVSTIGGVVINEILSSSTPPAKDRIELKNVAPTNVTIGNWYLTDDPGLPQKFRIPPGTVLAPGQFIVYSEDDFNPTPGLGVSFGLSSFGDDVYLFSADAAGQLTGYSHGFNFGAAQDGVSFGRYINSVSEEDLVLQIANTFPGENSGPRVGPVVVTEVNYHPTVSSNEFIELRNLSGSPVQLFDPAYPTNTWKLSGLGYTFPMNVVVPAGGMVLLVNDSTNSFRSRFNVPAAVQMFQYTGTLQDSGEEVEVRAPDAVTTNGVPYYAVDRVRYNDRKPWPLAADGAGASLQRLTFSAYGNDPTNWVAAVPTPGTVGIAGTAPTFTVHPATQTNATQGTVTFSALATGTGPISYQWRFNGGNLAGATNSTLVLTNLQTTNQGTYQAVAFNTAGSSDSSNALLVLRAALLITNQPSNAIVKIKPDPGALATTNATFTVAALTYNPPLSYQWRFNGQPIVGATNSSLTITNVQLANQGAVSVAVSDAVSTVLSSDAMLYPVITPILSNAPVAISVTTGAVVSLSAETLIGNPLPFSWEWKRGSLVLVSNLTNERFSFFSFVNTQAVGNVSTYVVVVRTLGFGSQATFNISTVADTDGDGMPDNWENAYGLASGSAADRNADPDNDGLSNWQEYIAGSNPTNSDALKLSVTNLANGASVRFTAMSNKTYTVQFKDTLNATNWQTLQDVRARNLVRDETVLDPAAPTNRFYRVVTPRQ